MKILLKEFNRVFDHPDYQANASLCLMNQSQGQHSVSDYTIEFWTLAAEVNWTEEALKAAFTKGLSERIKDELISQDEPACLESLISLSNRIDNRLRSWRQEKVSANGQRNKPCQPPTPRSPTQTPLPTPSLAPPEEPMQLGRAHLSPEKKSQQRFAGECIYCSKKGHYISSCPVQPKEPAHQYVRGHWWANLSPFLIPSLVFCSLPPSAVTICLSLSRLW